MPFFQKQDALKEIHAELKLQIEPTDEIIIADDFSFDGVPDFNCPCTKIVRPPTKLTPHIYRLNTLRNIGIRESKNDAVIILDPDCLPNPTFLKSARALFDPSILYAGRVDKREKDGSISPDKRTPDGKSAWIDIDRRYGGGGLVWGGNMMFSKSRALLAGCYNGGMVNWFDEEFNGSWGAEEHEFASRCYHSGMRLYYSAELGVTHLWHPPNRPSPSRNVNLWLAKAQNHAKSLNSVTAYQPAVGVSVMTLLRPELLNQCLRSIFRSNIPLRVRVAVNGDNSQATKDALNPWRNRWAVEVVEHGRKWPAFVRNDMLDWAKSRGLKYLVFYDDDLCAFPDGITQLVSAMEKDKSLYACSGYIRYPNGKEMMLGGPLVNGAFSYLKKSPGMHSSSWVGGGFTIHRLDPLIHYDDKYETGYNDYDWGMEAQKQGHKLGVCGDAGAWHGAIFTKDGVKDYTNPPEYRALRYDDERHARMRQLFKSKWGFEPRTGKVVE